MMFYLYVLQNQWIVITLLAGVVLMLLMCLTYVSMWHPRGVEQQSQKIEITGVVSFFRWLLSFVPWVVILLVLGCMVFAITTVICKTFDPPNW